MDVWSTLADGSNLWDQESLSKISEARHWHWLSVTRRTNFLARQVSDKRWLHASGMQRFGIGISRRVEAHEHLAARHQRHQGSVRSAVQDELVAFSVLISNSHSLHRSPHYISLSVYLCIHIYAYPLHRRVQHETSLGSVIFYDKQILNATNRRGRWFDPSPQGLSWVLRRCSNRRAASVPLNDVGLHTDPRSQLYPMMSCLLSLVSDTWFFKPGLGAHFWSHKSELFGEFVMVEGMTFTVSDLMTSPSHSWDVFLGEEP